MKQFPEKRLRDASQVLRAIAHELRLAVLCHLCDGPMTVTQLMEATGASQSNLSQHLAKMRMMGLLQCERRNQQMLYSLANPEYARIVEVLKSLYCAE